LLSAYDVLLYGTGAAFGKPGPPNRTFGFATCFQGSSQFQRKLTKSQRKIIFMNACSVCGKSTMYGQNIRHVHSGQWATRAPRTKRTFKPNLQSVRTMVGGTSLKVKVCTKCIKAGKVTRAAHV
jgi:large subunit ribosomal protein L28